MSKSRTTTAAAKAAALGPVSITELRRAPTHPGETFRLDFREPSGLSQAEAARRLGMPTNRLNTIELGKRAVSVDTALLFAALTGTSPEFWMHLQVRHDLWHALRERGGLPAVAPLIETGASR
jgi:addiction module HigA family antidote